MPPKTCWAMAVTSRKVRQAKSLAMGARRSTGRPSAAAQAASWTRLLPAVDGRHGVGHVVGDGLEGAQRLVELAAVLGVLDGDVERVAGPAHGLGGRGGCSRRACTASQVAQPVPAPPIRPRPADVTTSSHPVLGVRADRAAGSGSRPPRPGRRGTGRCRSAPSPVRARTTRRRPTRRRRRGAWCRDPEAHPSASARSCTPAARSRSPARATPG